MRTHYIADPHQDEGLEHLMRNPRACLFWEMSLGKTVVTLTYLNAMIYQLGEIGRALIIAPDKVANGSWPDEIDAYEHLADMKYCILTGTPKQRMKLLASDAQVFIVSVGTLEWLIDLYIYRRVSKNTNEPYGEWLGRLPFDCVVIDELSMFKNSSGVRYTKLERALRLSAVPYRVGLTGTPAPNGYQDLWAQILLIDDGQRLGDVKGAFISRYFTTSGNGMITYRYTPKVNAVNIISYLLSDICSTLKTRDKIPLPPLLIYDVELELPPFERELYDALEEEYVLELSKTDKIREDWVNENWRRAQDKLPPISYEDYAPLVTVKTAADLSNKLLQVSSGAIYEDRISDKDAHVWHEIHTLKVDTVRAILEGVPENFILVYQFAHEKARILEAFPWARSLRSGKKSREDQKDWNDGKIKLLVGHPASMGHGLNLQFGGRNQIWWGPTWNLEAWLQTTRRSLRRGAELDVRIWRILMKGTRDMSVRRRVNTKESDQDFLFNEIKELKLKHETAIRKQRWAQQG